jgi:stringent starvation protein B
MAENSSPKYFTLKRVLEEEYVLVHINTAGEGLVLPSHLLVDDSVSLKLSRYFRGAMEVTTEKITAELLFNGSYNSCVIPMDAIWGCHSQRGNTAFWAESAPSSIINSLMVAAQGMPSDDAGVNETADEVLVVEAEQSSKSEDDTASTPDDAEPLGTHGTVTKLKTRSHLKRIK